MMGCRHRLHMWTCRLCRNVQANLAQVVPAISEEDRLARRGRAKRDDEGEALPPDAA